MKYAIGIFLVFAVSALGIFLLPQSTYAANKADFDPGHIIDDTVFYNSSAMTSSQIQNFLNAKNPNCDYYGTQPATDWGRSDITHAKLAEYIRNGTNGYTKDTGFHAPPYKCLTKYTQTTPQMEAASGYCSAISAGTRTAAQIINDVAKACGINPQVLIVLLEKEQSLVTDNWPLNRQLRNATGFACPDTAPCDPAYEGFFYQVYHAARQFKVYQAYPNSYNYRAGRNNNIYWHPDLTRCGSSTVYIQNQATAALYIYTPYRPNAAALNNLYGTGDSCSSYGNRNFWRIFTDWFGSTTITTRGAIGVKYNSLNGVTGFLGMPLRNEKCGLADGGCYQIFEGGSIYWTSQTGAQSIRGAIRDKWSSFQYEAGHLRYPITDEICGLINNGCYQQFQNGRIYWTETTGARAVWGAIGEEYTSLGSENGRLGYILSDETCGLINGGCYQDFQHGRIYWNPTTRTGTVNGAISERYYTVNAQLSLHGYPIGREICGLINNGCYQQFQNGRIYWTETTGAQSVWGAINKKYIQAGGSKSALGYPTAPETCGLANGGCYQQFQNGRIYWTETTGAYVMSSAIVARYTELGAQDSFIKYPVSDTSCTLIDGGCYQQFQNGRIYSQTAAGTWPVFGGIGIKYIQLGGSTSQLGYPTSGESYDGLTKTWSQQYQRGVIQYSDKDGAKVTFN